MIIGVGTDIVSVTRLKAAMQEHGDSFIDRILTRNERKIYDLRLDKELFFAGRWAAKEALSKALGTGIGGGMGWTDTEILNDSAGRPVLSFFGTTQEMMSRLRLKKCHISISHDTEYATAFIVLES